MLGALEVHRLEDDETLRVLEALSDSCELHDQRLDEMAPNFPSVIFNYPIMRFCGK